MESLNDNDEEVSEEDEEVTSSTIRCPYSMFVDNKKRKRNEQHHLQHEIHSEFVEYNRVFGKKDNCRSRLNGRSLHCKCLSVLVDDEAAAPHLLHAVANYQVYFGSLTRSQKQVHVIEWFRYASTETDENMHKHVKYRVPFETSGLTTLERDTVNAYLSHHKICISALMVLCGSGKVWMHNCRQCAIENILPIPHGLTGKTSNRATPLIKTGQMNDLQVFFENLRDLSEPTATRFTREATGELTIRDKDDKSLYLMASMSKRDCYRNYCAGRGMKVVTKATGKTSFEPIDSFDGVRKECVHWRTFHRYWMTQYKYIKVSRPEEDICKSCYIFFNRQKYRANKNLLDDDSLVNDDSSADDEDEASIELEENQSTEQQQSNIIQVEAEKLVQATIDDAGHIDEEVLLAAARHVQNARSQRELVNKKITTARDDVTQNKQWKDRVNVLIADYSQYLTLPFFGQRQPGDAYYFVPLNVNCFGIVNVANKYGKEVSDHLYAHVYSEGVSKRGGNNVASLIMKQLEHLGWLSMGKGKELCLVFDNCPGQNKNNHVIRLAPFLVEQGLFEVVNIIFLVVGHTKNTCDRLFNVLKLKYRNTNVYVEKQMHDLLSSDVVTVLQSKSADFYDFDAMHTQFYKRLPFVKKHHIFQCMYDENGSLIMVTKESNLGDANTVNYNPIKRGFYGREDFPKGKHGLEQAISARPKLLANYKCENLIPPGIPAIKQVTMYQNYRNLIPHQYRSDELYRKPPPDVWEVYKSDKEERKGLKDKKKKQRKKKQGD